eukprot:521703-Prorocentrum_minimum.AAC.2
MEYHLWEDAHCLSSIWCTMMCRCETNWTRKHGWRRAAAKRTRESTSTNAVRMVVDCSKGLHGGRGFGSACSLRGLSERSDVVGHPSSPSSYIL